LQIGNVYWDGGVTLQCHGIKAVAGESVVGVVHDAVDVVRGRVAAVGAHRKGAAIIISHIRPVDGDVVVTKRELMLVVESQGVDELVLNGVVKYAPSAKGKSLIGL